MPPLKQLASVEPWVLEFLRILARTAFELLRAGSDKTKQQEALMSLQEETKQQLDRDAFSDVSNPDLDEL